MVGDGSIVGNIHHKCLIRRDQERCGVVARHKSRSQANGKLVGNREALVPERWGSKRISPDGGCIVDQDIEMTLLDFHSLEQSLDLSVIRVIASNVNTHTTRRR